MLVLRVFDVVAAFLVPLPCKLTADFSGPTNRSAEKWSRHVILMVSLLDEHSHQAAAPYACRGAITQAAPRITQARATLTRVARA